MSDLAQDKVDALKAWALAHSQGEMKSPQAVLVLELIRDRDRLLRLLDYMQRAETNLIGA